MFPSTRRDRFARGVIVSFIIVDMFILFSILKLSKDFVATVLTVA